MKIRTLTIAGATVLLLAACGGGDDGVVLTPPATPGTPQTGGGVPSSATASVSAWTQFIASLLGTSATSEPLSLGNITPPTSETAEPQPVT